MSDLTPAQIELVAEMQRFAKMIKWLTAEIHRLTADIKADVDVCHTLARDISRARDDDDGSD